MLGMSSSELNHAHMKTTTAMESEEKENQLLSSCADPEASLIIQQELYGEIKPAPTKHDQAHLKLPKLDTVLTFPKQRKRSNSIEAQFYQSDDKENTRLRVAKRPSTCGKEGMRHFSTPLPIKTESLMDTSIPCLSPTLQNEHSFLDGDSTITSLESTDNSSANSTSNLGSDTPHITKSKFTSPLSVRSFSTPMSVVRDNGLLKKLKQFDPKTPIQTKLKQATHIDNTQAKIRQLKRDIATYQTEIGTMKTVKKYRATGESEKLDVLIEKWRDVAQMASNYMLNEARNKISQMGGIETFRERQKKSKQRQMKFEFDDSMLYRIEEYMETEEYQDLGKYEKDEILSKKREIEEMREKLENGDFPVADSQSDEDGNGDEEFSMKDLYRQMKVDYNLVYGQ
jgi:hypothetical protein